MGDPATLRSGGCHKKSFTLASLPESMEDSALLQHWPVRAKPELLCAVWQTERARPQPQLSLLLHVAKQLTRNNLALTLTVSPRTPQGPAVRHPSLGDEKAAWDLLFS